MNERPAYYETWKVLGEAIRVGTSRIKDQNGTAASSVQFVPSSDRAIVVDQPGYTSVQAQISLQGDRIEIKTKDLRAGSVFLEEPTVIQIETENGRTVYVYNGERTTDPDQVAEIVLSPILDRYRSAA